MIDIALLRSDPDLVRRTVTQRGVDVDVDRIVEIDAQLREATARFNTLRTQRRRQSMSREQVDPDAAQAAQDELRAATEEVRGLQELRDERWARVPNVLPPDTPAGDDDSDNVELRREGDPVAPDDAASTMRWARAWGFSTRTPRRRPPPAGTATARGSRGRCSLMRSACCRPAGGPRC